MSKYIKLEDALNCVNGYFLTGIHKAIESLPTIDIVECDECRWRDDCSQTVGNFEKTVNTVLRWCSDGVRKDNE